MQNVKLVSPYFSARTRSCNKENKTSQDLYLTIFYTMLEKTYKNLILVKRNKTLEHFVVLFGSKHLPPPRVGMSNILSLSEYFFSKWSLHRQAIADGGGGMEPDNTTAKKAWASFIILPLCSPNGLVWFGLVWSRKPLKGRRWGTSSWQSRSTTCWAAPPAQAYSSLSLPVAKSRLFA